MTVDAPPLPPDLFRPGIQQRPAAAPAGLELPVRVDPRAWVAYSLGITFRPDGAFVTRLEWPR